MIDYKKVDFAKILKRYDVESQNETTPEAVAKKMLPADPVLKEVAECVLYMKFKEVGPVTTKALSSKQPLDIINNGLVVGPKLPSSCTLPRETPTTSERTSPLSC